MSLANWAMLFIGDTFFPTKLTKEVFQSLIVNLCASYWTKSHTRMAFTFIYSVCIILVTKQDFHRTAESQKIQAGREFRRSSVQSPAPSWSRSEVRSGCSGLCPIGCWKPPHMKTAQPLWAHCATAGVSSRWRNFSLYPAWTSLVSVYVHCRYSSHYTQLWRTRLHLFDNFPAGVWEAAVRCIQSHPCSRLKLPTSLSLSPQGKCSHYLHPDAPLLNILHFVLTWHKH